MHAQPQATTAGRLALDDEAPRADKESKDGEALEHEIEEVDGIHELDVFRLSDARAAAWANGLEAEAPPPPC